MRVIRRVHCVATHTGPPPQPAIHAGLTLEPHEALKVPELADAGPALERELANLGGSQLQCRILAVLGDDGREGARGAYELAAGARPQLNIVNDGAHRDGPQWQGVAGNNVGRFAGDHLIPRPERERGQDVAEHAVLVLDQCHMCSAIRRVLNSQDCGRDVLATSLEINKAKPLPGAPATVPCGDPADIVVPGVLDLPAREARDHAAAEGGLRGGLQQPLELLLLGQREGADDGLHGWRCLRETSLKVDERYPVSLDDW
mmetsp:Transcript_101350/g.282098  ORF Transcript_101350/g.282098 Transcript_101350/m.282098 type:complete len:259 (-) Transcript_101350:121-897(-)